MPQYWMRDPSMAAGERWYCAETQRARQRGYYAAAREKKAAEARERQATLDQRMKRRRRDLAKQRADVTERLAQLQKEEDLLGASS